MDGETVYAACPKCLAFVESEDAEDAQETAESHNESRHQGEDIAGSLVETNEEFAEFLSDVQTHANEDQMKELDNKMSKGRLPMFISAKDYEEIYNMFEE